MKPQLSLAESKSPEELKTQLQDVMQKLEEAEEEKNSYETLVEIITQHSTDLGKPESIIKIERCRLTSSR